MLRIFSKVSLILVFLVSSFFTVHNPEAKSQAKLGKKYIPPGNPGGANFYADEDFAESYKLYEKRRELLKKKKLQGQADIHINKKDLIKRLKEKRIASLDSEPNDLETCIIDDEESAMINQYGINVTRLKGAVFIDQELVSQTKSEEYESKQQQEGKKFTSTQEKKIPPVTLTIKEAPSRKTSLQDSIANLDNVEHSLNGSSSFGSVADTVK